ncbi:MAG: hypothetical protein A2538_04685 [Candidatus Magasanikbacteria bacterium RIFOXYD2_FULL_41_14]|uniref:Radical SAM core domain-containing protein n=1 Tax=Candidatus Magasanikbacteria bacterium RIFOXYD2_FULL_41_14 TaxID=1798709 RepID=A0A1F6PFK5_9BACT|nr:MAG: hypothetical protein A2538_04685 [Candidatus Magasanikbacteria bacterium RIFOXYD2_FULL_41_14]
MTKSDQVKKIVKNAKKVLSSKSNFKLLTRPKIIVNLAQQHFDAKTFNPRPGSTPGDVVFSLTNICNLSCPMCSINNIKAKCGQVPNFITFDEFKKFAELLAAATRLSFMGFIGESILNPDFFKIISYLKKEYKTFLHISTNGNGLNEKVQDQMLAVGFDSITFSIHGFSPESYKTLQAGSLDLVKKNLARLLTRRKELKLKVPYVTVVFALNRANIDEAQQMLEWVAGLGADAFHVYHFHDYTPTLKGLIFKKEEYPEINKKIDALYEYAQLKGWLNLLPPQKPYFKEDALEQEKGIVKCDRPWKGFQMRSSFSHKDCYYMGVCNVFNSFLFNYKEHLEKYGKLDFQKIWQHPVLQYLRQTSNSAGPKPVNPLCAYCKSSKRKYLKNTDNAANYKAKLEAIDGFFKGFKKEYPNFEEVGGVQMLYTEDDELALN